MAKSLKMITPAAPTPEVVRMRDGSKYRRYDDGSLRHYGGHRLFGKALKTQVRRAKAAARG